MESSEEWINSIGGRVRVLDISPENKSSASTVLLACGWAESIDSIRATADEFVKLGYRVLAIDYADLDDLKDVHKISGIFPKSESIKSMALLKILEEKKINNVIGLGHSEGAISLLGAATLSPYVFQNIVLITPAGLIEGDSFFRLSYRYFSNLFFDVRKSPHSIIYYSKVLAYSFKNPIQTIREAFGIANIDLSKIICDMQNNNIFPKISIFYGKKDKLFYPDLVDGVIRKQNLKNFHLFDGYHNDIHTKAETFVPFLESIIRK